MSKTHEGELGGTKKEYVVKYIGPYNQEYIDQTVKTYGGDEYTIIIKVSENKNKMEVSVFKNVESGQKQILLESDNTNVGC